MCCYISRVLLQVAVKVDQTQHLSQDIVDRHKTDPLLLNK